MMTATMERKYAMTRLATGDYICPSNDLTKLWQFHSYEDGRVHGLVVDYERRTFWRATWMPMEQAEALDELPDRWSDKWREADWYLPSRQAAINEMLRDRFPTGPTSDDREEGR